MVSPKLMLLAAVAVLSTAAQVLVTPNNASEVAAAAENTNATEWEAVIKGVVVKSSEMNLSALPPILPPTLSKRNMVGDAKCCPVPGQDWHKVDTENLQHAIGIFNSWAGWCAVQPHSCSTPFVSTGDACLRSCNDNAYAINVPCTTIAWYANQIIEICGEASAASVGNPLCGQAFDNGNWNTVISQC